MRIYCTKEADNAMLRVARQMGLQLYEYDDEIRQPARGRFAGHESAVKLLLRPRTGEVDAELFRLGRDGRRVWAASWAGHYVFMRAILAIDAAAIIVTSVAEYRGLDGFTLHANRTGDRNIGSMVRPQAYADAEAPGHVLWYDLAELDSLAIQYAGTGT